MDEFVTRLKELLDYLEINPIMLADKMGVQRSTFSHLLSGRNKPGFEFLVRLQTCYPAINLNWLISGQGAITVSPDLKISPIEKNMEENQSRIDLFSNIFNSAQDKENLHDSLVDLDPAKEASITSSSREEKVERLIIVYTNGKMVEVKGE